MCACVQRNLQRFIDKPISSLYSLFHRVVLHKEFIATIKTFFPRRLLFHLLFLILKPSIVKVINSSTVDSALCLSAVSHGDFSFSFLLLTFFSFKYI